MADFYALLVAEGARGGRTNNKRFALENVNTGSQRIVDFQLIKEAEMSISNRRIQHHL